MGIKNWGSKLGVKKDLTGQRFSRLLVLSEAGKTKSGNYRWLCLCDCGSEKIIPSDHLTRRLQPVVSCGCYRDERIRETCSPDPDAVAFRLLYGTYRKRSLQKKIDLTLTDTEFRDLTSSNCHYCGEPPSMVITNKSKSGCYTYNSIDRIDSKKGYTQDNTLPSCHRCNIMKMAMGYDEFLEAVRKIYKWTNKEG